MSTPNNPPQARDAAAWAKPIDKLKVTGTPAGATNLNVDGKQVVSPLQGFGQLWQKTYRVPLSGAHVSPAEVIKYWKEHLPDLMPPDSRFYPSLTGIQPGEVVLINANVPGVPMPVSTGVLILFADDESFAVMTPQGHPESGLQYLQRLTSKMASPSHKFNHWRAPTIRFLNLGSASWAVRSNRRTSGGMC